jgi:hypothetical protein
VIVRILGEGQYDVADSALDRLNQFDAVVESAVGAGDQAAFEVALKDLLDCVRTVGVPHPVDAIDESDVILPSADSSIDEVAEMLADDGLIPG